MNKFKVIKIMGIRENDFNICESHKISVEDLLESGKNLLDRGYVIPLFSNGIMMIRITMNDVFDLIKNPVNKIISVESVHKYSDSSEFRNSKIWIKEVDL